jgi:hypothetical protein
MEDILISEGLQYFSNLFSSLCIILNIHYIPNLIFFITFEYHRFYFGRFIFDLLLIILYCLLFSFLKELLIP